MNELISQRLVCPYDHEQIALRESNYFECKKCQRRYPVRKDGIADFLPDSLRDRGGNISSSDIKDNSAQWRPGLRYWTPGFLTNILRFGRGSGRLMDKQSSMTMLDVGCGGAAQGDVNCDIYIPSPLPQNFVLASAELLPFKDDAFDIVRSAYVIEHNLYPVEMLKEHLRVSKKMVKTYTDNSDWLGAIFLRVLNTGYIFHDEHYFKWSKEYFTNILNRLGVKGRVRVFNASPSFIVKASSILGKLPRIGTIFYRDLYVEIYKK